MRLFLFVLLAMVCVGQASLVCSSDANCTADLWKCGRAEEQSESAACSLPSDEVAGRFSRCACHAPACAPVEIQPTEGRKSRILFIGDKKLALMAEAFGARYLNSFDVYMAGSSGGINSLWASQCAETWLQAGDVWSYVVIDVARLDSSDATAVRSDSKEDYAKRMEKLLSVIDSKAPSARVVVLPVVPLAEGETHRFWRRNRVLAFNEASRAVAKGRANFCDLLSGENFGSPSVCGSPDWEGTCLVNGNDGVYPKGTRLQRHTSELVFDFANGFTTREGDMLTLSFLNKCLLYGKTRSAVDTIDTPVPVPIHLTAFHNSRGVIYVRRRVRVRVRVRMRVRVRRYVRVRRRVRVRYY